MEDVKVITIGNRYRLRDEIGGVTVHDDIEHLYSYYENLFIDDIQSLVNPLTEASFSEFIKTQADKKTTNIDSKYPFYLGWEVSGRCNLDCIYCFAETAIHTDNTDQIMKTAENILAVHPLVVGLSGGEPTLNAKLPDIIKLFSGKVSLILNTNGTTQLLGKIVPLLKEAGVLVRLTVDAMNNDLLNQVRPPVSMPSGGFDQVSILRRNIKLLVESDVNMMVHTVVTQQSKGYLAETAEELISLGVKRWHMYCVDPCWKCKDIFDDIYVDKAELRTICEGLKVQYGDKLHITYPSSSVQSRECAILLVDSTGRFFVNPNDEHVRFIGQDPTAPSIDEILAELDYETHKKCYLTNYWSAQ